MSVVSQILQLTFSNETKNKVIYLSYTQRYLVLCEKELMCNLRQFTISAVNTNGQLSSCNTNFMIRDQTFVKKCKRDHINSMIVLSLQRKHWKFFF